MSKKQKQTTDVLQSTLTLMVLKTLDALGPIHGYGIARRIEQISGGLLAENQGTIYPALLKLEQEGSITSESNASENHRKARFYRSRGKDASDCSLGNAGGIRRRKSSRGSLP